MTVLFGERAGGTPSMGDRDRSGPDAQGRARGDGKSGDPGFREWKARIPG